jgi:hypothetical protein
MNEHKHAELSNKAKEMNRRVTRLADWLLRIHARYESMNGFTECATLLHEQQAYIESLEYQLEKHKRVVDGEFAKAILRKAQEK